jgi:hypothetical protein
MALWPLSSTDGCAQAPGADGAGGAVVMSQAAPDVRRRVARARSAITASTAPPGNTTCCACWRPGTPTARSPGGSASPREPCAPTWRTSTTGWACPAAPPPSPAPSPTGSPSAHRPGGAGVSWSFLILLAGPASPASGRRLMRCPRGNLGAAAASGTPNARKTATCSTPAFCAVNEPADSPARARGPAGAGRAPEGKPAADAGPAVPLGAASVYVRLKLGTASQRAAGAQPRRAAAARALEDNNPALTRGKPANARTRGQQNAQLCKAAAAAGPRPRADHIGREDQRSSDTAPLPRIRGSAGVVSEPGTRPDLRFGRRR